MVIAKLVLMFRVMPASYQRSFKFREKINITFIRFGAGNQQKICEDAACAHSYPPTHLLIITIVAT